MLSIVLKLQFTSLIVLQCYSVDDGCVGGRNTHHQRRRRHFCARLRGGAMAKIVWKWRVALSSLPPPDESPQDTPNASIRLLCRWRSNQTPTQPTETRKNGVKTTQLSRADQNLRCPSAITKQSSITQQSTIKWWTLRSIRAIRRLWRGRRAGVPVTRKRRGGNGGTHGSCQSSTKKKRGEQTTYLFEPENLFLKQRLHSPIHLVCLRTHAKRGVMLTCCGDLRRRRRSSRA